MRAIVTTIIIVAGLGLMLISYVAFATPSCNDAIACSEPVVPFAAGLIVLGLIVAISSAIFYSVYKGK